MEWTRTDAARRRLVVAGLVVGPVLAVASVIIGLGPQPDSMEASFELMATRAPRILASAVLETLGFTITLGALVGAAQAMRSRGGVLGTVGALLGLVGIAGFGLSNGGGLAVVALAQLPDHAAAFQTAAALSAGGPLVVIGMVGMILEIAGQLGLLLLFAGLWRARVAPPWPLVLGVVGTLANAAIGTLTATLVADLLLVAAGVWVALRLARVSPDAWLGGTAQQATAGPAVAAVRA